jgi:anti-repressor protein
MKTRDFKFENGLTLRAVEQVENETSWFIAKDICDILGIEKTHQAVDRLDEDEKLMRKLYLSGQERETWTVNEFGLYTLILTSNKPEAKKFKRWVTHEVLPSIRKAGRYSTDDMNDREESIQKLVKDIEAIEREISSQKALISDKNKILKAKQSELKLLLKADIRQLKLNF